MAARVLINCSASWVAPVWVARNVLAHAAMWLQAYDHPAMDALFADGDLNDARVDFTELPVEQFVLLHRGARIGFLCSVQKSEADWHEPTSRGEFIERFEEFVAILEADPRMSGKPKAICAAEIVEELQRRIESDKQWQAS